MMPKFDPVAMIGSHGHPKHLSHVPSATETKLYGPFKPLHSADQIQQAYEAGKRDAAPGWQPIDTAPKDGTLFIAWVSAERWSAADGGGSGIGYDVSQIDFCWWREVIESPDCGFFDNAGGQIGDSQGVTHWMPISAPTSN